MGGMQKARARELRKHMTEAERTLWKHLRLRQFAGHKFRRQQPIGQYIVDFVCFERRLIIEVDGSQHSEHNLTDTRRTECLQTEGFRVLRFWNNQVLAETDAVKEKILEMLTEQPLTPHLNPPPQGGRP
jgi:very-short-patch-repair endonuclease